MKTNSNLTDEWGRRIAKRFSLFTASFRRAVALVVLITITHYGHALVTVPFEIANNSSYADSELFVDIVVINYNTSSHICVNPRNRQILPMDPSFSTVQGQPPNGNM